MVALDAPKAYRKKKIPRNVPEYLLYEIIDGKPYYYKGYRDVLNKTKTPGEIMGSSSYQWKILEYLLELLFTMSTRSKYSIATNEPGLHLDRRNNLAGDILVFRKEDLPGSAISVKYTSVPAYVHIEVDIAADIENETDITYLKKKINKLLDFGTKKIIWIFSESKQVLVVTDNAEWQWYNWDQNVELTDGVAFNISNFLIKEGIEINDTGE